MKDLVIAIRIFLVLSVFTGVLYPLAVTGIAQVGFKDQANGSLIRKEGKVVGSKQIGQLFDAPEYFWGRPSATGPVAYNAAASSGSNQGPLNPALLETIDARVKALRGADPGNTKSVPTELVTASGSGLDPHVSPAAAEYQVQRVAKARGKSEDDIRAAVVRHTAGPQLGFLGESVVNVLELNLDLDAGK